MMPLIKPYYLASPLYDVMHISRTTIRALYCPSIQFIRSLMGGGWGGHPCLQEDTFIQKNQWNNKTNIQKNNNNRTTIPGLMVARFLNKWVHLQKWKKCRSPAEEAPATDLHDLFAWYGNNLPFLFRVRSCTDWGTKTTRVKGQPACE